MTKLTLTITALAILTVATGCSESPTSMVQTFPSATTESIDEPLESLAEKQVSDPQKQPTASAAIKSQKTRTFQEYVTSYVGIGIYRESVSTGIRVTFVSPDSGAANTGVQVGDVVVSIDGEPLASADAYRIDQLLTGEIGDERQLELVDGRKINVTVGSCSMSNLGSVPVYNDNQLPAPELERVHADLRPVADMIVAGKFRAAERILETLTASHATNGSFYLMRAIHTAAAHGMLTPDSRNVPDGSADGKTLTQRITDDIDVAVELDEALRETAADCLAWLAVKTMIAAADNQTPLTYITSSDHLIWELEPLQRYSGRGDWITLLRKARQLSPKALGRHFTGLLIARDRFLANGDLFSATFLNEVAAYRYCVADPNNSTMLNEQSLQASEGSLSYLAEYLSEHPESAMDVAATFHAMCSTSGTNALNETSTRFQEFWKLLQDTSPGAAAYAVRCHARHHPPMFDRMATPKECFLYHIESFFEEDWDGFSASTLASVLEDIQSPQQFFANFNQNLMAESLLPMMCVTNGMLPEFISNAAQYEPFAVQNQHGVEFYLMTMRLNDVRFEQEVTMMVPMMAQQKFPTLERMLSNIASDDHLTEKLSLANTEGRLNDLVIGVVRKLGDGRLQVALSPAIHLLSKDNE